MFRLLLPRMLISLVWIFLPVALIEGVELYEVARLSVSSDPHAISLAGKVANFNFDAVQELAASVSQGSDKIIAMGSAGEMKSVTFQLPDSSEGVRTVNGLVQSATPVEGAPECTYRISGTIPWDQDSVGIFSLYVDVKAGTVQGHVLEGERFYRYHTAGDLTVTQIPKSAGMCVYQPHGPAEVRKLHSTHEIDGIHSNGHHHHHHHDHGHQHRGEDVQEKHRRWQEQIEQFNLKRRQLDSPSDHLKQDGSKPLAEEASSSRRLQTSTATKFLIYLDPNVVGTTPGMAAWGASTFTACGAALANSNSSNVAATREAIIAAVREDFAPFDVTITTNNGVYASWTGNRVRVALVESATTGLGSFVGGSSCGSSLLFTHSEMDNVVWVAGCGNGACGSRQLTVAQTISHEVAHTFGLFHDGFQTSTSYTDYLSGLPMNAGADVWPLNRRWNTIMGVSSDWGIAQWSKGQYSGASNTEDDIDIIGKLTGSRPIGSCNEVYTRTFPASETMTFPERAISCTGGTDTYLLDIQGSGSYNFQISTSADTNLKFLATLERGSLDASNNFVSSAVLVSQTNDAYASTPVTLSGTTTAGMHRLSIQAVAQTANTATDGASFPLYGSLGFYTLGAALTLAGGPVTPPPVTPPPVTPAPVTPSPVTPSPVTPYPVTPAPVTPAPTPACAAKVCGCGKVGTDVRVCRPQLRMSMRLGPLTVRAGESATLTMTVQNVGQDAVPTRFNLNLAAGLTIQSADPSLSFQSTSGAITMDLAHDVPAFSARTYWVKVQAASGIKLGSYLIEGCASTYGVGSVPKAKQYLRIRR